MVCKNRGINGFLGTSWVLITVAPGSTRTTDWWLGLEEPAEISSMDALLGDCTLLPVVGVRTIGSEICPRGRGGGTWYIVIRT